MFIIRAALTGLLMFALVLPANAQDGSVAINGTVKSSAGAVLGGVAIVLSGPTSAQTTTDAQGSFSLSVVPGIYTITATKTGFSQATRGDVVISVGQTAAIDFDLAPSSFQSLSVIGQTSSTSKLALNTSAAAVSVINSDTLSSEGTHQIYQALDQTPGVTTTVGNFSGNQNSASPGVTKLVQIRGALPYETQNLIDGHPVSIGYGGSGVASSGFVPSYLNPWLMDSIEVVKGPGYLGPDINYAITGTVNYRTLNPTPTPKYSVDFDYDFLGGLNSNYRATGTTLNGHLGYALDYALFGTPGPYHDSQYLGGFYSFGTINGTTFDAGSTGTASPAAPGFESNNFQVRLHSPGNLLLQQCLVDLFQPGRVGEAAVQLFVSNIADRELHWKSVACQQLFRGRLHVRRSAVSAGSGLHWFACARDAASIPELAICRLGRGARRTVRS